MDPSKPNEPSIDQGRSIPRSRPADDEVLEGEIIGKDEPLRRPGPVPPSPPKPPKRGLGFRKTLLIVVAVIAVGICIGGSLIAYTLYDKETRPKRSDPTESLRQYVAAKFERRDDVRVRLFICDRPDLGQLDDLLKRIKEREAETKVGIRVTLSDTVVTGQDATAQIRGNLNIEADESGGDTSNLIQHWDFAMVESNGWRLCGAKQLLP
ncbi:hypothetical protein ACFPIJ_05430 [Dactylosporangium cerinum]|uniref:Mce-associated membrane protein n=1 Tax=Dactylosporangium cerinum TaxID=1434730 RepID=A0ABV9VNT4_9ACTN